MSTALLQFLNVFFFAFHTLLILFNFVGWIWRKTRKVHILTIAATLFSWVVLAPILGYRLGYCFCTEWHWQVRWQLELYDIDPSYIQFLVKKLTGLSPSFELTNIVTVIIFALLLSGTLILNTKDFILWMRKRNLKKNSTNQQ